MQRAPSVMYPVGRCALEGGVLLALAGGLALVWAVWWWLSAPAGLLLPSVGGLACLGWSCLAWLSWRRPVAGQLHWDALAPGAVEGATGCWLWHAETVLQGTALQGVQVVVDGQRMAWLRLHGPREVPRWVCVQQVTDPARWADLRRAWVQASR